MNIQIVDRSSTPTREYVTLQGEKQKLSFSKDKWGTINTLVINASHRVWRGGGRNFQSIDHALECYKSPEVKGLIRAAISIIDGGDLAVGI